MVRFEVEISASVGGFSVNFGGQCHAFLDDHDFQKRNHAVSIVNWREGLKLLRWLRK
jgi:C1A family cysteine protease